MKNLNTTPHNIVPFSSSKGDCDKVESQLKTALVTSENEFGELSGEAGLALMAMINHYTEYYLESAEKAELVSEYQKRIDDIVAAYREDQTT